MQHPDSIKIGIVIAMLGGILCLLWLIARRQRISRSVWIWLGIYTLFFVPIVLNQLVFYFSNNNCVWADADIPANFVGDFHLLPCSGRLLSFWDTLGYLYIDYYFWAAFLLLVLLGALLARRHGRLAILLPLGYILPMVVYGGSYDMPAEWPVFVTTISAAILIYRFLLTIAAPVWIVRSASEGDQKRASLIGLWSLVGVQVVMFVVKILALRGKWSYDLSTSYGQFSNQLYLFVGIALAMNLYRKDVSVLNKPETVSPQIKLA